MSRSIEKAEFLPKTDQVVLSWKDKFTDATYRNAMYDYAMISAPFSKVRSWRFPSTCESQEIDGDITRLINDSVRSYASGRD